MQPMYLKKKTVADYHGGDIKQAIRYVAVIEKITLPQRVAVSESADKVFWIVKDAS